MTETKSCRKPAPVACRLKETRDGAYVVEIEYDNGVRGTLDVPVETALHDTPEQKEYERQMVFGRHMWDKKTAAEYEHLDSLISATLPD